MANKIRSHRGRMVDLDEIKIKNQEAVAVGNMNVNARGDTIDEYGRVTKSRDEVTRDKIKTQGKKSSTKASIISSFEDDDEIVEIQDDPKAIERNTKSSSKQSTPSTSTKTTKDSTETKTSTPSKGSGTSQTDLD